MRKSRDARQDKERDKDRSLDGLSRTSGVKVDSGTSMQKKPSDTQCVANLRMPK